MTRQKRKIVIAGGGTAGWMTAALLAKVLGESWSIELVESEDIGTIGVGEATIPPIQHFNAALGLDEAEFMRETQATIKLGIQFEGWRTPNENYFHSFGAPGRAFAFCPFHHFWLRGRQQGRANSLSDFDLNALCAAAGRFAKLTRQDNFWDLPYAYHLDAALYGALLRRFSEAKGVLRTEGRISEVRSHGENGFVAAVILADGRQISGDFFVDCSGMAGLLIQRHLGIAFEDWGRWLPCDRALAVASERHSKSALFTRAIAREAGWQWRIPLQHRNGNGLVYSSAHLSDEQASETLLRNLDRPALADIKRLVFRTGRVVRPWEKNVVAVGLAAGFLEPLESTSIYLIQAAIVRLLHLLPQAGGMAAASAEFNRQTAAEFEAIRDFLFLHYHLNARGDAGFWRDLRHLPPPDRLASKLAMFRETGFLTQDALDIFKDSSWLQVMIGQGAVPQQYHPLADGLEIGDLEALLSEIAALKREPIAHMPLHDRFIEDYCRRDHIA